MLRMRQDIRNAAQKVTWGMLLSMRREMTNDAHTVSCTVNLWLDSLKYDIQIGHT
jgi:hypothetical protein